MAIQGWNPITGLLGDPGGIDQKEGPALKKVVPGYSDVTGFLKTLGEPQLWERVAQVVIGGLFILFGLNSLLHNPAGKAAKVGAVAAVA
jgi:hypothetical protein